MARWFAGTRLVHNFTIIGIVMLAFACAPDERKAKEQVFDIQPDKVKTGSDKDRDERGFAGPNVILARCATFSPDGKRLAVGFYEKGVQGYKGPYLRFWDVASRKEVNYWRIERLPEKGKRPQPVRKYHLVLFMAYLPGSKQFLTVENDNMCRIWDTQEPKQVREFNIGEFGAYGGSLTDDGKTLMTLSRRGFTLWEVPSGKLLKQQETNATTPLRFSMSGDGKRALFDYNRSGSESDLTTSVYWDLEKDKAIQHLKVNEQRKQVGTAIFPLVFSPDSRQVLCHTAKDDEAGVVMCDAADLKERKTIAPMAPRKEIWQAHRAAFSPDSTKLMTLDHGHKNQGFGSRVEFRDLAKDEKWWSVKDNRDIRESDFFIISPTEDTAVFIGLSFSSLHNGPMIILNTTRGTVIDEIKGPLIGLIN